MTRSDSTASMSAIAQTAKRQHEPPAGIRITAQVLPYWEMITAQKAYSSWTEYSLGMASDMANCMYRLEVTNQQLRKLELPAFDDDRIKAEKLADMLAKRLRLLAAHLQLHDDATQGKSHRQVSKNKQHNSVRGITGKSETSSNDISKLIPGLED